MKFTMLTPHAPPPRRDPLARLAGGLAWFRRRPPARFTPGRAAFASAATAPWVPPVAILTRPAAAARGAEAAQAPSHRFRIEWTARATTAVRRRLADWTAGAPGWLRRLEALIPAASSATPGPGAPGARPSIAVGLADVEEERVRLRVLYRVALAGIAVVVFRLASIQVISYPKYSSLAKRQHVAAYKLPASRGAILDRNGRPLAVSQEGAAVYLIPRYFFGGKEPARPKLVRLCALLGRSVAAVRVEAARKAFVWLKRPATPAEVERVRLLCQSDRIQGVGWEPLCLRMYPEGRTASQLLGCTNDEGHGLEGLEYGYDKYLHRGGGSMPVLKDSRGRLIFTGGGPSDEVTGMSSLTLTIDLGIQHATERELEQGMVRAGAKWGCAIVMVPSTGEILALANTPRYFPDAFQSASAEVRANHAVSHVFEPGSTFKLVALASALQENLVREEEVFDCERGAFVLGDQVIHDVEPYGRLTLPEMVAYSSNIGFAKVGLRLGASRLLAKAREFGFGELTRIGLPGEERGLLRKPVEKFDIAAMSFGQGLAVTPIQIAAAYGAVANGGVLMRPFVVREVRDTKGRVRVEGRPERVRQVVSATVARRLSALLTGVVDYGTGTAAAIRGVRVAGKTGTAQKSTSKGYLPEGEKLVTFVGFLPAEAPRFLVLVTMDRPRWGTAGGVVGPVFREIAQAALRLYSVPAAPGALAFATEGERAPRTP
jgi:cell division protein FtsI (penicillin-binding protein 3)